MYTLKTLQPSEKIILKGDQGEKNFSVCGISERI